MINKKALDKVQGCQVGVAIGDGIGMAVEMMTQKEIFFSTMGQGVTGFIDPIQIRVCDTMGHKRGQPTDDWRLTSAIARSLLCCGGLNIHHLVMEQIREIKKDSAGFGPNTSTVSNLMFIDRAVENEGKVEVEEQLPASRGDGNGVAIKVSPLALVFFQSSIDLLDACRKLGRITHRDPQAWMSAYILGLAIGKSFETGLDEDDVKRQLFISDLVNELNQTEIFETGQQNSDLLLNLKKIQTMMYEHTLNLDNLKKEIGTGCYCAESVPFAIGVFLLFPNNFQIAVLAAINCGGDTDSTGSMVGALVGANVGLTGIPENWRTFRPEYLEAAQLGEQLCQMMFAP